MRRIAVQLFGHLRSYKKTVASFNKYIVSPNLEDGFKVDVFMHTWSQTDHSTITWHNTTSELRGTETPQSAIEFIKTNYQLKKFAIEDQIEVDDFTIIEKIASAPRAYKGVVNVAYTKFRSTELRLEYEKENNIQYDYVILTRPDIIFHTPFRINAFLSIYNEYKWDIPANGLFFAHNLFARGNLEDKHLLGGIDIIFFATPNNINKATALYGMIENKSLLPEMIRKDFYCFEIFWYEFWQRQGLEPIRLKYFQFSDYNIIRNEDEYNLAMKRAAVEQENVKKIKLNTYQMMQTESASGGSRITWLSRKIHGFFRCLRQHGIIYTIKLLIKKCLKRIGG